MGRSCRLCNIVLCVQTDLMEILYILRKILIGVPIGFAFVKSFALDTFGYIAHVDGTSMQPTLNPDSKTTDYVFLNHWSVRRYNIHRGDVISFISPNSPDRLLIKRVVGLAGDVISTINYKTAICQVPDGHCWVEGDHTGYSMDSNTFGPVALGLITGKATYIVWPPRRWRYLISFLPSHRMPLNLTLPDAA